MRRTKEIWRGRDWKKEKLSSGRGGKEAAGCVARQRKSDGEKGKGDEEEEKGGGNGIPGGIHAWTPRSFLAFLVFGCGSEKRPPARVVTRAQRAIRRDRASPAVSTRQLCRSPRRVASGFVTQCHFLAVRCPLSLRLPPSSPWDSLTCSAASVAPLGSLLPISAGT